ncbi:MAG: hypothetical protein HRT35_23905 [Algicola sp.]|nr:hypothetical protein [Algicola sp.]
MLPLFMLLGIGDLLRPGGPEGGFVAMFIIALLTVGAHRRAAYKSAKVTAVIPTTQDEHCDMTLPFSFETPPRRRPAIGYFLERLGNIVVVFCMMGPPMFLCGLGMFILSIWGVNEVLSAYWPAFLCLTIAGLIFPLYYLSSGVKMREHGRRLGGRDGRPIVLQNKQAPVLMLRSFDDETLVDPRPLNFYQHRYEENLARALKTLGPVITIGHPGDEGGYNGAARLYVADSHWQEAVEYLMQRSAAVLIIVGRSEGLWWEIEQALTNIDRKRLLFFFPYVDKINPNASRYDDLKTFIARGNMLPRAFSPLAEERQRRYQHFRLHFSTHFDGELPEQLGDEQFIDFGSDGHVRLLKGKKGLMGLHPVNMLRWSGMRVLRYNVALTIKPFVRKLLERH